MERAEISGQEQGERDADKYADPPRTPSRGMLSTKDPFSSLKGGLLDIKKLGKELQDPKWKGSNESIMSHLREHYIWEEMDVLRQRSGEDYAGIYLLPSFSSIWEWHGVICVRSGIYQHGCFKFKVRVPAKYPMAEPKISFLGQSIPCHPFVDPRTGLINFRYLLVNESNPSGDWNPRLHRMYILVKLVKALFHPNTDDPALKDLPGDAAVNAYQMFNPSFHAAGDTKELLKKAVANPAACQVLTANLVWWRKHGARVAELEKQLGCKIGSKIGSNAEHQAASSTPAASAVSGMPSFQLPLFSSDKSACNREALVSEAQSLWQQLQDRAMDYQLLAGCSVVESQDKLNFNEQDFSIRVRTDVEHLASVLFPGGEFEALNSKAAEEGPDSNTYLSLLSRALLKTAGMQPDEQTQEYEAKASPAKILLETPHKSRPSQEP